jgi:inward rectifier potassium channel
MAGGVNPVQKPGFDPGLTQQYTGAVRRVIAQDGTFNIRTHGQSWRDFHAYMALINMSWPLFFLTVVGAYLVVNTLFALVYFRLGPGELQGGDVSTPLNHFLNGFFFSAHTLTTVGYGSISPKGLGANIVAVIESMAGVLGFAVATGLLFGRVSRPSAKFGFSDTMVVAPYQDGTSLQFRIANRRGNDLMELSARVLLMTVEMQDGRAVRRYNQLKLERDSVLFLALTWTIVHPINAESPLLGLTAEDLEARQTEFLVLIKAFDDTFSQIVFGRYSYRHDEVQWGKKFAPTFSVDKEGALAVELQTLGAVIDAPLAIVRAPGE